MLPTYGKLDLLTPANLRWFLDLRRRGIHIFAGRQGDNAAVMTRDPSHAADVVPPPVPGQIVIWLHAVGLMVDVDPAALDIQDLIDQRGSDFEIDLRKSITPNPED